MPDNSAQNNNVQDTGSDEKLWTVNEEAPEDGGEASNTGGALGSTHAPKELSMDKIIDKAVNKEKKLDPKKPVETVPKEGSEKTPAQKRKLKVGEEEIELDDDAVTRWAQKGIHYEKKNYELAKRDKEVKAIEAKVRQTEQEAVKTYEALKTGAFEVLEEIHGPDKARALAEAYLRPKVETEMKLEAMTPAERRAYEAEQQAAQWKAKYEQREQKDQEVQLTQEEQKWSQHYQELIVKGLGVAGVPRTDFTAAEMASWIRRGRAQNVEYTPEQLASLVKEDNIVRVGALTENHVNKINEARKSGDIGTIVKTGEFLAELLGEPVVYALAKYHLAKNMNAQTVLPKSTVDIAKVNQEAPKKKMSYDEYQSEVKRRAAALQRGEQVPEW